MTTKDRRFVALTILTSAILFAFVFWLGFPGFFQVPDIYNSLSVTTDDWHPVIIARVIQALYFLFGKHSYYLFALNILCFYAGFAFFIVALYVRTGNAAWYALFSLTAVGNIFFQNFVEYHSFALPMLLWLGCAMIFFQLLVKMENRYAAFAIRAATCVVLLLSLLWRHNAIFSVYPLFMLFTYVYMEQGNGSAGKQRYAVKFAALMLLSAGVLVAVVMACPYLLSDKLAKSATNHIFLHQIVGTVVPADDQSFIPKEWYRAGKGFEDVKRLYEEYPTNADYFGAPWEPDRPFEFRELPGLRSKWFEALRTYPGNWVRHVSRFFWTMWFQDPAWIFDSVRIQAPLGNPAYANVVSGFPEAERKITFTPLRKNVYDFLFKHKLLINHFVGVAAGFLVLLTGICLWSTLPSRRDAVLLFSIATSLSSCCTAVVVCVFSPSTDPRYMSPVLVLSLIGVIGLMAWFNLTFGKNDGARPLQVAS